MKAKGFIFSKWYRADYRYLKFDLNLESDEKFEDDCGDAFPLEEFLSMCKSGALIDYDGYADEILLDGKVVWNKGLAPSEALFWQKKLREANAKHDGKLQIVWYNR